MSTEASLGRVVAIWRYPVKSMAGESVPHCELTLSGLVGDRAYALVDVATGAIGSAKNPRAWPDLLNFGAAFIDAPKLDGPVPKVRVTLPKGKVVVAGDKNADAELSAFFGRPIRLSSTPPEEPILQQYWPVLEDAHEERVTNERMPTRTFFDLSSVNVLFTTTLDQLSAAYRAGRFDIRRFRPNIVISPEPGSTPDPEANMVGRALAFAGGAKVYVDSQCGRCVMTTLAQGDLTKDLGVLRTIVQANGSFAGLNTSVKNAGALRVGDAATFAEG